MLRVISCGMDGVIEGIYEPGLAAEVEAMNCVKAILAVNIWSDL
jgi:hypothetical protein